MSKSAFLFLFAAIVSTTFLVPSESQAMGKGISNSDGFSLCESGDKYRIKKGKHSAKGRNALSFYKGTSMKFTACFEKDAKYDLKNSDQGDINKLYGFSDCGSGHQKNSIRIGWNWNIPKSAIEVFAYSYSDKDRNYQSLGQMAPGEKGSFELYATGDQYLVKFNGKQVYMPRGCSGKGGIKHRLFPYFGGDQKAPHDIHIRIDER